MCRRLRWLGPLVLGGSFVLPGAVFAQTPVFDVSTVKPTPPVNDGHTHINYPAGGDFSASNVSLLGLMEWAFEMPEKRILGAPAWMSTQRFDLMAKSSPATAAAMVGMDGDVAHAQKRRMVQALLQDRFALKLHPDTQTLGVYDLVQGGPVKMKPSTSEGKSSGIGRNYFRGEGLSSDLIAQLLSRIVGKVVVDRTRLTGRYDVRLEWTPDDSPDPNGSAPSFLSALPEQLGLKLVSAKESLPVLVIDHVEQPSPN